jgi:hypothetical protein
MDVLTNSKHEKDSQRNQGSSRPMAFRKNIRKEDEDEMKKVGAKTK